MDDKNFWEFLNEDVPMNHNIQKYMMVTRNKLREYYEPNKVKAALAVFGKSYEYREAYNRFKKAGGKL